MIKKIKTVLMAGLVLFPTMVFTEIYSDKETKLSWQTITNNDKLSWNEATKYCQDLIYDGSDDWYLPNIYELKSLVDYNKYNPAIKDKSIDIKLDSSYWSSSLHIGRKSNVWVVDFKSGKNDWLHEEIKNYVLCVRK